MTALNAAGIACDETRVSRWESGAASAPQSVVRAYEKILGLERGSLAVPIDSVHSVDRHDLRVATVVLDGQAELENLLEKTFHGSAEGEEWLHLVRLINVSGSVFLRESEWLCLARKLATEQCRAFGLAQLTRVNALRELIQHPRAQRHVLKAIGELILDERVERRVDLIQLVALVSDPHASALILRLLNSDDARIRMGAATAAAAMVVDGTFTPSLREELAEASQRLTRSSPESSAALDLSVRVAGTSVSPDRHELVERDIARAVTRTVSEIANPPALQARVEADSMLNQLIRDALFHSHFRRRQAALTLLAASPYADGVAKACSMLLGHQDVTVAIRAARVLTTLARDEEAVQLAGYAAGAGAGALRPEALRALAHLPSRLDGEVAEIALECLHDVSPSVRSAAAYACGMHGLLPELADGHPLAVTAAWWAEQGGRVIA
ncbi:HEAT repeat domain-containing protein [Nocardioides sp. Kera G14]|uniref:HEAT repeat domain-containing protein n=1 Tax=Nocardioides sp. Kera G14 TaxID=2884264 RepID=UPI001D10B6C2|nr:hypothetical protein [Nocardioides sp. Kera G14]UDY23731.1 hypothetical protein LH076_00075 [Nocardioides sp. Kera G14]